MVYIRSLAIRRGRHDFKARGLSGISPNSGGVFNSMLNVNHAVCILSEGMAKNSLCPSQKAPCNQFRAIELAMLGSKACDITGIVAIACTRHGCFAPNSIATSLGESNKRTSIGFFYKHCSGHTWIWHRVQCSFMTLHVNTLFTFRTGSDISCLPDYHLIGQ
jgi:hypothetical protein